MHVGTSAAAHQPGDERDQQAHDTGDSERVRRAPPGRRVTDDRVRDEPASMREREMGGVDLPALLGEGVLGQRPATPRA